MDNGVHAVIRLHDRAGDGKRLVGIGGGDYPRVRVSLDQARQPLGIEMVGMLMGDEYGVQSCEILEAVRVGARVEQDPGSVRQFS